MNARFGLARITLTPEEVYLSGTGRHNTLWFLCFLNRITLRSALAAVARTRQVSQLGRAALDNTPELDGVEARTSDKRAADVCCGEDFRRV